MSSQEGVQHGAHQPGHASVQHDWPLGVRQVQVADRQQLCHKVSHAHGEATEEAGDESDGRDAAVGSWKFRETGSTLLTGAPERRVHF